MELKTLGPALKYKEVVSMRSCWHEMCSGKRLTSEVKPGHQKFCAILFFDWLGKAQIGTKEHFQSQFTDL